MLSWLMRRLDRTPTLDTDALRAPRVTPPPVPPNDLGIAHLAGLAKFVPGERGRALEGETDDTRALSALVFERFRAEPAELPAFPALAIQIFEILERPKDEVDVDRLVQVLSREPAISALMLRVANSPRFGTERCLCSVRDAVVRLGMHEVSNLAVAAASRSLFDPCEREQHHHFERFWSERWRNALTTAFSASWLSMETRVGRPQEAFVAGLLHDLGKTLGLRVLTELVTSGRWSRPLTEPTIELVLETTHVDVGAEAMVRWELPVFLLEVCQEHHSDGEPGLPMIVRLAADTYDLQYNPLHRASLPDEVVSVAGALKVDAPLFANLATQVTTFAAMADDIAVDRGARARAPARASRPSQAVG